MQLYSLYHRDAAVRRGSSSGGAFTCITDSVFALHDRVAIWGCTLNAEQRAVHTRATDRAGRDAMRGSKYVASSGLGDAFRGVRRGISRTGISSSSRVLPVRCRGCFPFCAPSVSRRSRS